MRSDDRIGEDLGSAAVEQVGLMALLTTALVAGAAALVAHGPLAGGKEVGGLMARKLTCAPHLPGHCWRDRLIPPYGEPLARLVRALAPDPGLLARRGLVPVDFRRCRQNSCAIPEPGERGRRLTRSNRRIKIFTEVRDRRRSEGTVEVTYWMYRPGQPWERISRTATGRDVEAASGRRLGLDESPVLIPLETLAGRNHIPFRQVSEPPWRWQVTPAYPGRVP